MLNTFKSILKLFSSSPSIAMAGVAWKRKKEMLLKIFAYLTVTFLHFTGQSWISKTMYCNSFVMVCKIFSVSILLKRPKKTGKCKLFCLFQANAKIALLRASMAFNYYIKLFCTWADRHNGILMSLLLLVAETTNKVKKKKQRKIKNVRFKQ